MAFAITDGIIETKLQKLVYIATFYNCTFTNTPLVRAKLAELQVEQKYRDYETKKLVKSVMYVH